MKVIQQGGSFLYFCLLLYFYATKVCGVTTVKVLLSSNSRHPGHGSRLCLEVCEILDHILVRKYSMPDTDYFLFVCLIMHVFWEQHCPCMHGISTPLKQKSYFLINMQISGFQ